MENVRGLLDWAEAQIFEVARQAKKAEARPLEDLVEAETAILEEVLVASGRGGASLGTVVIGTVENDVHDIGKNIVSTLLRSHGFKVVDLGRDVAPSAFLDAAQKEKADIIAMSSLMTTTRPSTRSTINLFKEVGVRGQYKFIVGGGCITQEWGTTRIASPAPTAGNCIFSKGGR